MEDYHEAEYRQPVEEKHQSLTGLIVHYSSRQVLKSPPVHELYYDPPSAAALNHFFTGSPGPGSMQTITQVQIPKSSYCIQLFSSLYIQSTYHRWLIFTA